MTSARQLQSVETDTILNTIDELRSDNLGDILELPQIIVCGDQSSGKSAVLNAVSTLNFLSRDTLCTRFATEVIMRPGAPENIVVSIVPSSDRSSSKKREFEAFRKTNVPMCDIAKLTEEATELMGIDPRDPQAKRFSNDILRFEVTGPQQPSLTLVDLPGLFQTASKDQTDEDTKLVKEIVLKYMKNKRSVILAVISAKSEFVLQTVTKYSRRKEVDPHGLRTLGIITKPDKLDANSESEQKFMELAQNRLAHLNRGWHVLVNRDYTTKEHTQDQRDEAEKAFLSRGVWAKLPSNQKGVYTLRSRLSGLLRDLIVEELPSLMQDAENEIEKYQDKLSRLGMSRATPEDRRRYLTQASQTFNVLMRSCVNGSYDDKFFGDTTNETAENKRLRAIVQNTLVDFADAMQSSGHAKHIVDEVVAEQENGHPNVLSQKHFEEEVVVLMKKNRGRELIGMYNPLIIQNLFVAQSVPWAGLIRDYRKRIWTATKTAINLVLGYATDETTMLRLKQFIIVPALEALGSSLDGMIQKLLSMHREKHPITYSRRLVDGIRKAQQAKADKVFENKLAQAADTRGETVSKLTVEWLLHQHFEVETPSLERYAASEAIEVMRAYYKIAKETVVDNFSTLAVEDCLISRLPDLLSPEKIAALDDETIDTIAMETDAAASERAEAEDRLESSTAALIKLRRLDQTRRPATAPLSQIPMHFKMPELDLSDEDDAQEQSSLPNGTDVSKLDQGLSDLEDRQTISTNDMDDIKPWNGRKKPTRMWDSETPSTVSDKALEYTRKTAVR